MCLGIPGQVIRMLEGYGDQLALVDVAGEQRKVNVGMLPEHIFEPGADAAMEGLELMGRGRETETSP
jgi:hydrogenase expression/formation protein HypC